MAGRVRARAVANRGSSPSSVAPTTRRRSLTYAVACSRNIDDSVLHGKYPGGKAGRVIIARTTVVPLAHSG